MRQRTITRKMSAGFFLVAAAVVIAACGGTDDGTANEAAAPETATTAPDPTTTSLPAATAAPDPTSTSLPAATTAPDPTSTSLPAATPTSIPEVPDDGETLLKPGILDAGTVVLAEEFDVRVALTTDGGWKAVQVGAGAVVVQDIELVSPFTRGVLILSGAPFAAESVDEWAAKHDDVTVEARLETQVSGYESIVYDLTYDGEGDLPVLTAPATFNGGRIIVRNMEYYRIWLIDIGADKPLALFMSVLRDDFDWLEKGMGIVDSIEIG